MASLLIVGVSLAALVAACGCIFNGPPSAAATDAANATAENLFQSLNTGDYGQFSTNFSAAMITGINQSAFEDLREQIRDKYGDYLSKSLSQSSVAGADSSFVYSCAFRNGTLRIRLVMNTNDQWTVDGLWLPDGV